MTRVPACRYSTDLPAMTPVEGSPPPSTRRGFFMRGGRDVILLRMSDSPNHKSRSHTGTYVDPASGQVHILRADNTADGLRLAIAKALDEYGIADRVKYTVEALDGPWIRLDLHFGENMEQDDWYGFPTDVSKAMQGLPHGYYEVKEQGQNQDGTHLWFIARHDYGPLI